jgi:predicted GNAT family acetyltransferase
MTWEITHDVAEFQAAVGDYFAADPVRNTVLLTVSETVRLHGPHAYEGELPARFGWWRAAEGAPVEGAFVHTPPHRPILGPMPDPAARGLVRTWRSSGAPVTGATGVQRTMEALADEWRAGNGESSVFRSERLFRLDVLTPPQSGPAGAAGVAGVADLPLLADWFRAFSEDIGMAVGVDHTAHAARRVEAGQLLLWRVDGVPVSMAGFSAVVAGQARVAPVYTPADLRGRGYAGAVTCAASEAARAAGAGQVLLFTDVANPTSNALYQRLGYRPLGDYLQLDLTE